MDGEADIKEKMYDIFRTGWGNDLLDEWVCTNESRSLLGTVHERGKGDAFTPLVKQTTAALSCKDTARTERTAFVRRLNMGCKGSWGFALREVWQNRLQFEEQNIISGRGSRRRQMSAP